MNLRKLLFVPALIPVALLLGCPVGGVGGYVQVFQGSTEIVSGGSYDFGSIIIGVPSNPVVFTIKNGTSVTVSLDNRSALSVTGTNSADFSVASQPAATIPAGSSTTFSLVFTPSTSGQEIVQLALALESGSYTFSLKGSGTTSGTLQMKYNGDGLQNLANGETAYLPSLYGPGTSNSTTFTINNSSASQPLYLGAGSPVILTEVTGSGAITTSQPPLSPIAPNSSADFVIKMDFLAPGTYEDTVTLKTSDPTYPTFTFTVTGYQGIASDVVD